MLDPEVVKQILVRRRRDERIVQLSEREREVLGLMAEGCLLYTSPSPRDRTRHRMPSSA